MFGLTFEKLFVVAVLAAVIIGPSRLPGYAARLAELVRGLRAFVDSTRTRTESELGVAMDPAAWHAGIRQYDPRHIVRQALDDPPPAAHAPSEQERMPVSTPAARFGPPQHPA